MTTSVFITFWFAAITPNQVDEHFRGEPLSFLSANTEVVSVEHYLPAEGDDVPVFDDIPAPKLIVQIDFASSDAAVALVESAEFQAAYNNKNMFGTTADKINVEVHETAHYDIPGYDAPPPRTKPLSFVVRYYGPVENAAEFAEVYTTNHPPILAKFPNVRNVLCYLPLNWENTGQVTEEQLVVGNEVVFDTMADLNAALASPVLQEAIADSDTFKSHGYSSHHAMWREYVYQRN